MSSKPASTVQLSRGEYHPCLGTYACAKELHGPADSDDLLLEATWMSQA